MAGHILQAREDADPDEDALLCRLIDMALMQLGTKLAAAVAVEHGAPLLPDLVIAAPRRSSQRGKAPRRRAR